MDEEKLRRILKEELDPIRCKLDPDCEHYIMAPFLGMQENYQFAGKLGRMGMGLIGTISALGGGFVVIQWLWHLLFPPRIL